MKSDTEPAIIAFRNRVAEMCKAEVSTEDAVKGDRESNGLIENAVMLIPDTSTGFGLECETTVIEKRPVTDTEPGMQTGDPLEMGTVKSQRCPEHHQQTQDEELLCSQSR